MNREIFMEQLAGLLVRVPSEERDEALQYYENYFNDAGEEKEEEVIKELVSPEMVAFTIMDDLGVSREIPPAPEKKMENQPMPEEKKASAGITVLLILTSIIWVPFLFATWIVCISLIFSVAVVIFSFGLTALICIFVGFAVAFSGIVQFFVFPAYGMIAIGGGLITSAVGFLFVLFVVLISRYVMPLTAKLFKLSTTLPGKVWEGIK